MRLYSISSWKNISKLQMYSQYVANNADTPHVRRDGEVVVADDFRSYELRCSEESFLWIGRVVCPGQTEVYELDFVRGFPDAQNVLGLCGGEGGGGGKLGLRFMVLR